MSTAYQTILVERDAAGIARLTLNRPDRLNAINDTMQEEMGDALEALDRDDTVRVVVVTGAGRAFSAGGDTQRLAGGREEGAWNSGSAEAVRRGFKKTQRMMLAFQRIEKPTIAMVNGVAVGAGMDLACACDIRVGCPNSRFMVAYIKVGLFPGFGGTWLYARHLPLGKAAELLFTGDWLEAEEAHRLGLLQKLVPVEELESATMEMARKIAEGPPIAIRLAKLMLYKGLEFDFDTALAMAATGETITLTSQDHQEGMAAFREKRKPSYKGR